MNEKQQQQQQHQNQTFPFKLYEMLEYARASGYSSSISWLADGTGFVIHNKDAMMNDITPISCSRGRGTASSSSFEFDFNCSTLLLCLCLIPPSRFRPYQPRLHFFQTRQLNLWGFLRTKPRGDKWKHKDFLRERPDLLKEIVRIEIKSKSNSKSNSAMKVNTKATASSRSAGSKWAAEVKGKRVKIEVERVVSPPSQAQAQAQADSNPTPTQFSYDYDNGSADASAAVVASQALRYLHATQSQSQGSVFQYCSANVKHDVQSHNQDSVSLLSSVQMFSDSEETTTTTTATTTTTQTQVASTEQKAVINTTSTHATHRSTASDINAIRVQTQPFNDDELLHLADIFERDSPSHDDDLRSILSLDRESAVEEFMLAE
eukprot:scaffold7887_cov81-Skeletonema_dohrnii-CCMP3373.AAC.7